MKLRIYYCKNLWTLPDEIMQNQRGDISSNYNLQELRICVLPTNLKILSIGDCRKLESISEMLLGPTSPDDTDFVDYPNLKSLPESLCTNLTLLRIGRCESIESFPEIGLPSPNLRNLHITDCQNLKYVPSNLKKLTSLRLVYVWGCGDLVTLPEMGLPPSLEYLGFGDCEKVEKQMWDEWSPDKFPFLAHFSIKGGFRDAVCFPPQESQSLLPPALTSLHIIDLSNLESLSSAVFLNLTSLTELGILECPKLLSLPMEALPPSLLRLCVMGCPELERKCEERGEYWPRLSFLPDIEIRSFSTTIGI